MNIGQIKRNLTKPINKVGRFLSSTFHMTMIAARVKGSIFVTFMFLQSVQGLEPVATAWVSKLVFDELVTILLPGSAHLQFNYLLWLVAIQGSITLAYRFSQRYGNFLSTEISRQVSMNVQLDLYRQISTFKGLRYFEDPEFYKILGLGTVGAQLGSGRIIQAIISVFREIVALASFLGVLLTFNPVLAILVTTVSLPHLVMKLRAGQERVELAGSLSLEERKAQYLGGLQTEYKFAKEIRLFNLAEYLRNAFQFTAKRIRLTKRLQAKRELHRDYWLAAGSEIIKCLAYAFVIFKAFSAELTVGDVVFYAGALKTVQIATQSLVVTLADVNEYVLHFEKYRALKSLPPTIILSSNPCQIPPLNNGIEFKKVSFRYSDDKPWVLRNCNLIVPMGYSLGLVGKNGVGKTTLIKLLLRFYDPTEGSILWDGIDIREFEVDDFRSRISMIFQDYVHYDLTVRENIGFGNVPLVDNLEEVQRAANRSRASEFIKELPHGYDSILSHWLSQDGRGMDLSIGQWQKIALARMFMRDADLLMLDEPTSALDVAAEHELFNVFKEAMAGTTSIIVSHRFTTILIADIIAVLTDGQISEYGSHDELMRHSGIYSELYSLQTEYLTKGKVECLLK